MNKEHNYLLDGVAALALAVLFPLYWIIEIGSHGDDFDLASVINGLQVNDLLFLTVGLLNAYFYVSVRRILFDHHHYSRLNIVFALMIGLCAVFYLGTFAIDALAGPNPSESVQTLMFMLTIGSLVVFGVLDIVVGALLLMEGDRLSSLVRVFAIVSLVQGIVEITVVLSPLTLFLFPVSTALMAVYFLREPEAVEIV